MSTDAISLVQAVVRDQLRSFRTAELGIVTAMYSHESAADKNNYECDLMLRDSGLELKRVPVSSQRVGAVAIPNKDDMVLVQFLHGDIHSAVIMGRLYNDANRPPEAKPHEFIYISPDSKESGIRRLYLELPNNNKLLLDDEKVVLEMGKTKLTLNHDGDVVLESNAKLTVKSAGDASVKVQGSLDLTATGDVSLEGNNVSIKGNLNVSLEGGAAASVKAAAVTIAGKLDFSPA